MSTNGSVSAAQDSALVRLSEIISNTERSPKGTDYDVEINAVVKSVVQQKLHDLFEPLLIQLLKTAGAEVQGTGETPLHNPSAATRLKKSENTIDDQAKVEGIRFSERDISKRNKPQSWKDPRESKSRHDAATKQFWLHVNKIIDHKSVSYEIDISDKLLVECIKDCLSSFIAHSGQKVWQRDEVVLTSEIDTLVLNYHLLSTEANRQPTTETRTRLRRLLDIVRSIQAPPILMCIDEDIYKDFRIEIQFLWPLFGPGKLIVVNTNGFDLPQLLKIDRYVLNREKGLVDFTVFAWMWDWDGKNLVRTMYEFTKQAPEHMRVNPKEWNFYPVEFYESANGIRGLDGFQHDNQALHNRRTLFIEYTGLYVSRYRESNLLRYSGDAFSDAAAFAFDRSLNCELDLFGARHLGLLSSEKSESKLVKLDEDIILDAKNYFRRVYGNRKYAGWRQSSSKFCKCGMCLDPNTKTWFNIMSAISRTESTDRQFAVQRASGMPPNNNDLLLTPRVFGFALKRKQWCQFSLEKIQQTQKLGVHDDGVRVDGLVFPSKVTEDERRDIFKLIRSHKRVMSHKKRLGDTIDGKGESLILLFHGHSGTGKTLYAESLAKACDLGLFKVGTNDIGLDAAHAERRLKEIFEYAESWNTILLIDEADVLLDTRGRENESLVSKNALVSVLLREVEYFKGILIMTTNRVRAFDPAILSRIHHAVDFEGSTQEQELKLWFLWYESMVEQQLCTNAEQIKQWIISTNRKKKRNYLSGREVRNVFLVAQILAEDENKDIKIGVEELERAYIYKDNFLAETEGKINEAKAMVMSGMKH